MADVKMAAGEFSMGRASEADVKMVADEVLFSEKKNFTTPMDNKRNIKPSILLKSPYLAEFSSGNNEYRIENATFVVPKLCPLDNNLGDVLMCDEYLEYHDWIGKGHLRYPKAKE
ncbi:uncharacterized protein LOC130015088 [Mercurialis annua]|uniref:uncharacterized protein LOC130015088 n=1 Tax=Mercurialis annua TaxID=3986 RepID=UPI0024ACC708|nr:uncharacterized protein LOC130015088 [Mercurialis annua]